MWRETFSSTTIASSTTKPVATVSAISDRLSSEKPARYITPNVPISDTGTATVGISAARAVPQEQEHDHDDERRPRSPACARPRCSDARIVGVRSMHDRRGRSPPGSTRAAAAAARCTRSTVSMMLAPGCRLMISSTDGLAVGRAGVAQVLHRVDDFADVGQPHRRAVAVGDDDRHVLGGLCRLVVGVDLPAPVAVLDRALGPVGVGCGDRARARPRSRCRSLFIALGLSSTRTAGSELPPTVDLADAFDLRELLREDRRRGVVHLPLRHRVRRHRHDQHRRVGGIDLAVGRIAGQARRQRARAPR